MHYPQASHKEFQLEVSKHLIIEGLEQHQTQLRESYLSIANSTAIRPAISRTTT